MRQEDYNEDQSCRHLYRVVWSIDVGLSYEPNEHLQQMLEASEGYESFKFCPKCGEKL